MQCLTFATSKGGQGKTSLTVNLAIELVLRQQRVLVVDLDQQGQSTLWLAGDEARARKGAAETLVVGSIDDKFLTKVDIDPRVYDADSVGTLHVLPGNPRLENVQQYLANEEGPASLLRLAEALDERRDEFDYVLIDLPPSRDKRVGNALCAADWIIIPVGVEELGLRGWADIVASHKQLATVFDELAPVIGEVLFRVDRREKKVLRYVEEFAEQHFFHRFENGIRISTEAKLLPKEKLGSRAKENRKYVDQKGAEDYALVLDELLNRIRVLETMKGAA